MSRGDEARAHSEHDGIGDPREELDEGEVHRHQPLRADTGLEVVVAQTTEALDRLGLVYEGLGDSHAGDALLKVGVDDGDPLAGQIVKTSRLAAEDHGGDGQRDDDRERTEPELQVDDQECDPHSDKRDEGDQRREEAVLDERFELVDVGRHPGHDPSRHLAFVVVQGETLHLPPDAYAQRQHDPLGGTTGDEGLPDLVHKVGQRDRQVDGGRPEEHGQRIHADTVVDARLDQDRAGQAGQRIEHNQDQPGQQRPTELAQQPCQVEVPVMA